MQDIQATLRARWRIAGQLTFVMIFVYFGFIGLVAFRKDWMAAAVTPGLSFGILLGALVIVSAWILTYIYVHWANAHYDPVVEKLRAEQP